MIFKIHRFIPLGGPLISQQYPSGRVVSYAFDDAAGLSQVSSGSTVYANQFDYSTAQGLLKQVTLGNGAVESYGYNSRLQMSTLTLAKDSSVLQKYEYKYGAVQTDGTVDELKNNGQIGRIESWIGSGKQWQERFSYDSLGRLSTASEFRGDNSQQSYLINYDYDVFGNRFQKQARNGGNPFTQIWTEDSDINQSTNRFAANVGYDDAGNVLTDQKFRQLKFQYDANNRQKQSSNLDETGVVKSVYDAGGQRVATQVNNSLTNVLVYDATGKLLAEYGSPAPSGTQYFFSDHQGSPRAITSSNGLIVSRHDYLPFGEELGAVGMRTSGQGYSLGDNARQKYAGMEGDDATGMAHTLWRQYDSSSGRWTSPDPYGGSMSVGSPQTFNRYSYVNNDPVNQVDPSGLMASLGYSYRGAELSWGQVEDSFWGRPDVSTAGRREIGWAHIADAQYRLDNLRRTTGRTSRLSLAKAALAAAAGVSAGENGTPPSVVDRVTFTEVALLSNTPQEESQRKVKFNEFGVATLNLDNVPDLDILDGAPFTIRVTFELPHGSKRCCDSSDLYDNDARLPGDSQFKFASVKISPTRTRSGYELYDNGDTGYADITLRRPRITEGTSNKLTINVSGIYGSRETYHGTGTVHLVVSEKRRP